MSNEMEPQFLQNLGEILEPWQPLAAPLSAMAAVITAIIAIVAIVQTAKDSRERTRPLVTPFAQVGPSYTHGVLYLVVKNFGATAAHNVRVTFDPPLPEVEQKGNDQPHRDSSAATIRKRYAEPAKILAPGQALVNVWTNRAVEDGENQEREGIEKRRQRAEEQGKELPKIPDRISPPLAPDALTVTVSYEDRSRRKWPGFWRRPKQYTESVLLRMQDYDHESRQTPGDSNDAVKRQAKAIEAAAWEIWRQ